MKLRALECLCEIAACEFNLSRAAKRLHATQPAITRQIQLLEQELGFPVLLRRGNKALGFTEAGQTVFARARTIVNDTHELGRLKDELLDNSHGKLVVATTQFHARYTLLPAIRKFRPAHPHVSFSILSVDPSTAAQLVLSGNADFGLSGEAPDAAGQLLTYPCFEVRRLVIVPRGHPLIKVKRLTLKQIARYPLIVYDARQSGGRQVLNAFAAHGITPEIALSASDADVIKSYVAAGVGIAIVQDLAYDKHKDDNIQALDPGSLFRPTPAFLMLRKNSFLRTFTREFITLLAPKLAIPGSDSTPRQVPR